MSSGRAVVDGCTLMLFSAVDSSRARATPAVAKEYPERCVELEPGLGVR